MISQDALRLIVECFWASRRMTHWRHGSKFDNSGLSLQKLCVSLHEQYFRTYEDSLDEGRTKLALITSSVKVSSGSCFLQIVDG